MNVREILEQIEYKNLEEIFKELYKINNGDLEFYVSKEGNADWVWLQSDNSIQLNKDETYIGYIKCGWNIGDYYQEDYEFDEEKEEYYILDEETNERVYEKGWIDLFLETENLNDHFDSIIEDLVNQYEENEHMKLLRSLKI